MNLYRKRQPVEARQLTADTRQEIKDWLGRDAWFYDSNGESELYVDTDDGGTPAVEGDWIVRDSAPTDPLLKTETSITILKPSDFEALYEVIPKPDITAAAMRCQEFQHRSQHER